MSTRGAERAHRIVLKSIKAGRLPRIAPGLMCVDCGKQAQVYDHRDYNKPLDVESVCHRCNVARGPAASYADSQATMERKNFYFPEQLLARLRAASKKTGLPVSELIRRAMTEYLRKEQK